jgi:hypothetical protein
MFKGVQSGTGKGSCGILQSLMIHIQLYKRADKTVFFPQRMDFWIFEFVAE